MWGRAERGRNGIGETAERLIGSVHSLALDLAILRQLAQRFLARGVVRRGRGRRIRLFLRACNRHGR